MKQIGLVTPLVSILIALILGVFDNTPFNQIITFLFLPIATYGHLLFYIHKTRIPEAVRNWYGVGWLAIIVSVFTSYKLYRQSFFDSFIATQNFYQIGAVIYIYYLIDKYHVSLKNTSRILLLLGWINMLILLRFYFLDLSLDFRMNNGDIIVMSYGKLNKVLLIISALLYYSRFLIDGKSIYFLFSLLFFAVIHLEEIQRMLLIATIVTLLGGLKMVRSVKVRLRVLSPMISLFMALIVFINTTSQGKTEFKRFTNISAYFTNDDGGKKIEDSSVSIRLQENAFALQRFLAHPITGNGYYRSSNKERFVGDFYFYPADIGFFGVLYSLGIFGIVLFLSQYRYLLKSFNGISDPDVYMLFGLLCLLFLMLHSLSTASSVIVFSRFLLYVCLLDLAKSFKTHK